MKTRFSFVGNSSSSSYLIFYKDEDQMLSDVCNHLGIIVNGWIYDYFYNTIRFYNNNEQEEIKDHLLTYIEEYPLWKREPIEKKLAEKSIKICKLRGANDEGTFETFIYNCSIEELETNNTYLVREY